MEEIVVRKTELQSRFQTSWQQTMLRIKDPLVTIPFYVNNFGFTLIHRYDFPQWKFSLYFLAILPEGIQCPEPGSPEAETFLWNYDGVTLELTHNHGSEMDSSWEVNNGNVEPYRGFGHIALMTRDVEGVCDELDSAAVQFQKKPNEGRMKGLAFALDPQGYWIEIVSRSPSSPITSKYTFAQTMLRVKDPLKSLVFYRDMLGMTLLCSSTHGAGTDWGFSLYFLAQLPEGTVIPPGGGYEYMKNSFLPVLELTHNHGTEAREDFHYHNGNDEDLSLSPPKRRGFGHTGFLTSDLDGLCEWLEREGVTFKKKPSEGLMRGLAFAYDPDGYWVELIQRGGPRTDPSP